MTRFPKVSIGDKISYVLGIDKGGWETNGHGVVVGISDGGDTVFARVNNKYVSIKRGEVTVIKEEEDE